MRSIFVNIIFIITFSSVFISCSGNKTFQNFDKEKWKEDEKGCKDIRLQLLRKINKEDFKGMDQLSLVKLLGHPDKVELYERNQQFFIYYLEPGKECESGRTNIKALFLRFNALGYVNEVGIENL